MTSLKPGRYFIINKAARNLAVQYDGEGRDINVQRSKKQLTQVWIVRGNSDGSQSISPALASGLQTEPFGNYIQSKPNEYRWNFIPCPGGTQIQNKDYTQLWGLEKGFTGEYVTLQPTTQKNVNSELQCWRFELVQE